MTLLQAFYRSQTLNGNVNRLFTITCCLIVIALLSSSPGDASPAKSNLAISAPQNTVSADLRQQFQPAKDDDGGNDDDESQELLYQWMNPRYSNDEQTQLGGIAIYFVVLASGLCGGRIALKIKCRLAR